MLGFTKLIIACMLATAMCTARPTYSEVRRDIDVDWPVLFGAGNFPDMFHLTQVKDALKSRPNKFNSLVEDPGATSFWLTLYAITKCHPQRNWIRSMFDNPVENEQGDRDEVNVVLYESETLIKRERVISTKDILQQLNDGRDDEWTLPLWPLVLAEAAHFAGWSPNAKDNQVKQLLETFTGRKASVITGIEDEDKRWEAISNADVVPVIVGYISLEVPTWWVVNSVIKEGEKLVDLYRDKSNSGTYNWGNPLQIISLEDPAAFDGRPAGA